MGSDALGQWINSFKRDPNRRITPKIVVHSREDRERVAGMRSDDLDEEEDVGNHHLEYVPSHERERQERHFDLAAANFHTSHTNLSRELKGRHLQMIAIGGSIGMA